MAFNTYNEAGVTYSQIGEAYNGGSNISVLVSELNVTSTINDVSIVTTKSAFINVDPISLLSSIQTVTVVAQKYVVVSTNPLELTSSTNAVVIRIDKRVNVEELSTTLSLEAVSIDAVRNLIVITNAIDLLLTVQSATIPRIPSEEITVMPIGYTYKVKPISEKKFNQELRAIVNSTNQNLVGQDLTYNQAGLTYNEIGFVYGGSNKYGDKELLMIKTNEVKPIISYIDKNLPIQKII